MDEAPGDNLDTEKSSTHDIDELEELHFSERADEPTGETKTLISATTTAGLSIARSADVEGEKKYSVSNVFGTLKHPEKAVQMGRPEPQQGAHSSFDKIQTAGPLNKISEVVHSNEVSGETQVHSDRAPKYSENAVPTSRAEPQQVSHSSYDQVQTSLKKLRELVHSIRVPSENKVFLGSAPTSHELPIRSIDQFFDRYEHNFRARGKTLAHKPLKSSEPALPSVPQMAPKCSSKETAATASKENRDYSPAGGSNSAVGPAFLRSIHQCNVCHQTFTTRYLKKCHRYEVHTEDEPFECDMCEERFETKRDLLEHYDDRHGSQTLFECNLCFRKFLCNLTLKHHHRLHIPGAEQLFECTRCDRKFSLKGLLLRHQYHDHADLHKCSKCNRTFSSSYELKVHYNYCQTFKEPKEKNECN